MIPESTFYKCRLLRPLPHHLFRLFPSLIARSSSRDCIRLPSTKHEGSLPVLPPLIQCPSWTRNHHQSQNMSQPPKVSDCDVLPWTEIANQIQEQVLAQVQQQKPELLRDEFDKQFVSLRPMGPVQGLLQKFEELWFSVRNPSSPAISLQC
jgi:hypothetical protein